MISKILEVSTAHVMQQDMERLRLCETSFSAAQFEYGVFMFIPTDNTFEEYTRSFRKLIDYARLKDCRFILLDQDAEVSDDPRLDINEW